MQDFSDNDNNEQNVSIGHKLSSAANFIFHEVVELVGFIKNALDVVLGNEEEKKKSKDELKKNWLKVCKHVGLIMLMFGTNLMVLLCAFVGCKVLEALKTNWCQSEKSKRIIALLKYVFIPVIILVFGINSALFFIVGILLLGFYNLASNFDSIIQKLVRSNGGIIWGINIKEKLKDALDKINTYEKDEQPASGNLKEVEERNNIQ